MPCIFFWNFPPSHLCALRILFYCCVVSLVRIHHSLFIQIFVNGHLGSFQVLQFPKMLTCKNAYILVHVFWSACASVSQDPNSDVVGNTQLLLDQVMTNCFPTSVVYSQPAVYGNSGCSIYILFNTCYCQTSTFLPVWWEQNTCGFNLYSPFQ